MEIDVYISTAIVDGFLYPVLCMKFGGKFEWVRLETAQRSLTEMRSIAKGAGSSDKVTIMCAGGEHQMTYIELSALITLISLRLKTYRKESKNGR